MKRLSYGHNSVHRSFFPIYVSRGVRWKGIRYQFAGSVRTGIVARTLYASSSSDGQRLDSTAATNSVAEEVAVDKIGLLQIPNTISNPAPSSKTRGSRRRVGGAECRRWRR